jgi:hypothetical protein
MSTTAEPPSTDRSTTGEDDVKRKFREALERKNARHSGGDGAEGKDTAKVHGSAHGPAHLQRTFRRKSG